LKKIWIVVAGVLALGTAAALAVLGVAPNGGHAWLQPIQHVVSSTVDGITRQNGGHAWL
jgi:hypothetical protein